MSEFQKKSKYELIDALEREIREHAKTQITLRHVVDDYEEDQRMIASLSAELRLCEMTIARLANDETIRVEFEDDE